MLDDIKKAADYIKEKIGDVPSRAIILGSGLGDLADSLEEAVSIPYGDIPGFPVSTAPGHTGRLVAGKLNGEGILCMQGRFHYYEGYDMGVVVFPVRVFKLLGITHLIVTNASGGVNLSFEPGDLMMITDHLSLALNNPLIGKNFEAFGERFSDLSDAYSRYLLPDVRALAKTEGIDLKDGVYAYMSGPSYETPAEIRMLRTLGADSVGMSTVPEVITANHAGIKVMGISCITNMAAGILDQPITGEEVIETGRMVKEKFIRLIKALLHSDLLK